MGKKTTLQSQGETLQPQEEILSQENQTPFLSRVKQSFQAGVCDASKAVEKTFTTLGRLGSKAIYGTCYGVSYGVTFAALSVSKVLPETMLRGFKEGAEAAEKVLEPKPENVGETPIEQPA
ncbi:MAG: hypothetical protein N3A55_05675 [Methylohalobius sp.]|nr:hypothetical protein [Methylohalobius sp.]